jgi:hypothetical protein
MADEHAPDKRAEEARHADAVFANVSRGSEQGHRHEPHRTLARLPEAAEQMVCQDGPDRIIKVSSVHEDLDGRPLQEHPNQMEQLLSEIPLDEWASPKR